jgi:PBSX family phage portal protein
MDQLPMMTGVADDGARTIEGEILASSTGEVAAAAATGKVQAFSFGEPEAVHDKRDLLGFCETWHNGRWYEPPVSMHGLTRAFDIPGPHASCIRLKVNLLVKHFRPSRLLGREDFRKLALDFLAVGNAYLERRDNLAGRPLALKHSLARFTRRGVEDGRFFFVPGWRQEHEFGPGRVFHMLQEHPSQEIYGVPEFFHALQAGLMGEAATLFRRRYYLNGSHAGFIFYCSEESVSNEDADAIKEQLKGARGVGNFKNLFIHAPKGKKDGVQIIPISEVAAKDEFMSIKLISRDEMLAAHRVPPQLLGVVPTNSGGFGDVGKANETFFANEIEPLEMRFLELNDWLGSEAVSFDPYRGPIAAAA